MEPPPPPTAPGRPALPLIDQATWTAYVQRGLVLLMLALMAAGLALLFLAVNDAIQVWLADAWVPVWRAAFAIAVVALALWVLTRVTGRRIL